MASTFPNQKKRLDEKNREARSGKSSTKNMVTWEQKKRAHAHFRVSVGLAMRAPRRKKRKETRKTGKRGTSKKSRCAIYLGVLPATRRAAVQKVQKTRVGGGVADAE